MFSDKYSFIRISYVSLQVIAMYIVNPSGEMELAESRSEEFITIK